MWLRSVHANRFEGFLLVIFLAWGCSGKDGGEKDAETEEADAAADTGSDADHEQDLDAFEDTGMDPDGDGGVDLHVEADMEMDMDEDEDGGSCLPPDAEEDAEPDPPMDADEDPGGDAIGDVGEDPDPDPDADVQEDVPTDAEAEPGLDAQEEMDADEEGELDAAHDFDLDTDVNEEPYADADIEDESADADIEAEDADDVMEDDGAELPPFTCGEVLVDSRDGRSYATVQIGEQCWMAQNLNIGAMILCTAAQTNNGVIEKYCYSDDTGNCDVYGGLYQWDEVMAYNPSDSGNPSTTRGICPAGWHVPSDEEWKTVEISLGMTREEADMVNTWRGTGVGTALKAGGSSGYEALLSGRCVSGTSQLLSSYEFMYTSTESSLNYAWRRCLRSFSDDSGRWNTFPKYAAFSLRCVLD